MNTLYMKIHQYEEASNSLIVSFASDTTAHQDPDQYPKVAFQPMKMWPDVSDPEEVKKRIALAGVWHAEQQEVEEKFVADPTKVVAYQNMAGSITTYSTADLLAPPDNFPAPVMEV